MFVTKRNQYSEEFDINKVKKVISWATKGLNVESLELEAHVDIIFKDGISTKEIQDNLIQHSLRLTSIESPDWRIVAGRLNLMSVWKEYTLPYQQFAANMVAEGKYHPSTIEFTDDEFEELEEAIDSSRDLVYDYAGSQVLLKKYIYKDEPIQYMYMATAARLASHEEDKLFWTLEFYNALSNREISLATPLLSGARKNSENLSSCFETKFEDSLEDIFKGLTDIGRISKNGGGVGTNISSIRASDSWVAGRAGASNGIVPWIKLINDTAIAVNQLGSRAAAITVALDVWHYDLEKFLNIGTEHGEMRNKAFDIFPQLVICDAFMRMAEQDSNWYMFDPYEVKQVLGVDLVNTHNAEFEQGYAACCLAADAGKLTLVKIKPAKEILKLILKTQVETSLPYLFFKDKVNRLNPNNHAGLILNANLCVESYSNTSSEEHHVCSLSSPNLAYVTPERLSYVCKLTTRLLDNVIDLTNEPTKEASTHTLKYRTIGVGALGLADYLVREGMTYESAYKQGILSDIFEEMCIACIEESIDLAEERGRYPAFTGSQWDTGSRIEAFKQWSKFPAQWDNLQDRINKSGIRNSQLMSPAPNTSTSLLQNATASVLPPFNVLFYNSSSEGMVPIIPPYLNQDTLLLYKKYSNFDMSRMIDYIEHICRWIDTGLSFELMYDLNNPVVTAKYMYDNIFKVWKSPSIKTMYYIRFVQKDGTTTEKEECVACAG